jgi:VWFA-related protein
MLTAALAWSMTAHSGQTSLRLSTSAVQVAVASAVHVPVSVREGTRMISGLTAADFVLTDNEVQQEVEAVGIESVPVDVTLVLDTSGSTTSVADRLAKDVQQIVRLLRKDDAFQLLRIDSYVEELRPMTPVAGAATVQLSWHQNGFSSVHDSLIAALIRPSVGDRRHLVVAITDGSDTMSITTADRVREVASRSDALLQIVTVRPPPGAGGARTFRRPRFSDSNLLILTEAAERTGGELRGRGLFGDADPVSAFKRVFDEFRQSYVLRYTPQDVERDGWHELSVSVPRAPEATVRARRGYYAN